MAWPTTAASSRAAGPDIYLWSATDERTRWVASDLRSMLDTWFTAED